MDLSIAEALCRRFEGFYARPYLCPAGVPTIGIGTTRYPDGRRVTLADRPITLAEAVAFMRMELRDCADAVMRLCPGVYPEALLNDDWGRFNALVDFCFNLGSGKLSSSTLRKRVNAGDWQAAIREIKRWIYGDGKQLPGLITRRAAEALLMTTPK